MPKPKDMRDRLRASARAADAEWQQKAAAAQREETERAEAERARLVDARFERAIGALEVVESPYTPPRPQLAPAPAPAEHSSPNERRSSGEPRSNTEPRSEIPPIAVQNERGSHTEPRSAGEHRSARVRVEWKAGELRIPNYIVDNLLPLLTQDEATVYLRLYRLAQYQEGGHPRGWCIVGAPKLTELTKIGRTGLFAALKGLEAKGLIVREAQEVLRGEKGGRGSQGNRYRVFEPDVEGRPDAEPRSTRERRSSSEPRSAGGRMKDHESKNMKAPDAVAPAIDDLRASTVGTLRAIARSYRHSTPDVDDEDVRTRLRQWFETEGRVVDEGMIDEGLKAI